MGWKLFFRAATAPSALERNSQYIRGFTLDSQTFGSQRNKPDVIARPGDYGYRQVKVGLGEENNDISLKIGTNGAVLKEIKNLAILTDLGFLELKEMHITHLMIQTYLNSDSDLLGLVGEKILIKTDFLQLT